MIYKDTQNNTVRDLETYIKDLVYTNDKYKRTMTVEHRSNNPKRDYLFVNRLQAKHIPCSPTQMINMCRDLADLVSNSIKALGTTSGDLKILVVGFAETATAIGHFVAESVIGVEYMLSTTRENIDEQVAKQLITFEEEHSHATTQKLFTWKNNNFDFNSINYILFVEDEISTGNTILNFIKAFKEQNVVQLKVNFGVASICNWQNEENKQKFKEQNIQTFALITGEVKDINSKMDISTDNIQDDIPTRVVSGKRKVQEYQFRDKGVFYKNRIGSKNLHGITDVSDALAHMKLKASGTALVIGTEECMSPAIRIGALLELDGLKVFTHSTTRSKIDIIEDDCEATDIIRHRYTIPSAYDTSRITYIYNLTSEVDTVIIVTDTPNDKAYKSFKQAITQMFNVNTSINFIRL